MEEEKVTCAACGAENPAGAVFCSSCGNRLDGKKVCPSCGALMPSDAVYCNACGKKLTTAQQSEAAAANAAAASIPLGQKILNVFNQKVCVYGATIGAMFAALCAFIFVLCMGIAVSGTEGLVDGASSMNIYYYFGQYFSEISQNLQVSEDALVYVAYYTQGAFGIIITVATLISVIAFSVLTLVRGYKAISGRDFSNIPVNTAVAATLSYIAGACALLMLNYAYMEMSYSYASVDASAVLSPATVAGIVLALLGLVACLAFCAVNNRQQLFNRASLVHSIGAIVGVVLSLVLLIIAANCCFSATLTQSGMGISFSMNGLQVFLMHNEMAASYVADPSVYDAQYLSMIIFAAICIAAVLAAIVITIVYGASSAGRLFSGDTLSLKGPVAIAVCAVIALVCAIGVSQISGYLFGEYNISAVYEGGDLGFGAIITLVVFAAIAIAVVPIGRKLAAKFAAKQEASQETADGQSSEEQAAE